MPFDITVDGDTVEKDGTVTLRERDTTGQVNCAERLSLSHVQTVGAVSRGLNWSLCQLHQAW